MSDFTKKWRVTHDEPLTYNERVINSACDIIEKQTEQIEELKQLLIEYGRHSPGCSAPYGYDCRCGWDRERKALEGK